MFPVITRFVRIAFTAMAIGALVAIPLHAQGPLVREHYSGTNSYSVTDCGFTINVEDVFSGLFMLKRGHHGDLTPYFSDNFWASMMYTNPETGKWFIVNQNGLAKDVRVTNVGGTVYRFDTILTGATAVVRNMDGNIVMRDHGLLHFRFTVDTKGDSDRSNDELVSFEIVADRGAHLFFNTDFCASASDLLL